MKEPTAETAAVTIPKSKEVVESVASRVRDFTSKGELVLPANYSAENSLKSAWLLLQETVDREKKPVLQSCTQASIANALLDMVVQGLNPAKKQMYFIAYGNKLMCQRSYFGTMALAKEMSGVTDIWAEVVYQDDVFAYEIIRNRKCITTHTQKLKNIQPDKIIAAYCVIEFGDGRAPTTEIMTMEQIKKSWAKSKMSPDSPNSTHSQYPDEMAKRTVINRACKPLINSSSDSNLFLESFNRVDEEQAEDEIVAEIAENANQEVIDVVMPEESTGMPADEGPGF